MSLLSRNNNLTQLTSRRERTSSKSIKILNAPRTLGSSSLDCRSSSQKVSKRGTNFSTRGPFIRQL